MDTSYNNGIKILKTLFGYLKTSLSFEQFLDSLKRSWDGVLIPEADFVEWVKNLDYKKVNFLKIIWQTQGDWDDILKSIASKTPIGKLPDRKMIDSAFLNPDNFKPSVVDYAQMTASAGYKAVQIGSKAVVGTLNFLADTKYLLLAGALGYIGYKFFSTGKTFISAYKENKK